MARTLILVAARQLRGGASAKGKISRHVAERGDHLTAEVLKKLGLGEADVKALIERGAIIEQSVLQAENGDTAEFDSLAGAEIEAVLLIRQVAIPSGSDKPALLELLRGSKPADPAPAPA